MRDALPHSLLDGEHALVEGVFVERSTDQHIRLKEHLLESGTILPPLQQNAIRVRNADFPDAVVDRILNELQATGLVLLQLDEPAINDQFIMLGAVLGTAMPETDPTVKPYVEREVILNLISDYGHTSDVSLQPFATNSLTLHTESSGRRAEEQPRYIVLMCCEPGNDTTVAQTVLIPMTSVEKRLTESEINILSQTRYRNSHHGPWLVRNIGERRVFSFRDFHTQPLEWTYSGQAKSIDTVNAAISDLLTSMYAPDTATSVRWARGMIVIIDNTFFFHGRTAGSAMASTGRRHLKRLRIM